MQHCDSTCFHCAQTFFLWLKSRMHQMSMPAGKRALRSGGGNFAAEAATSVKAPKAFEDCPVRFNVGDKVLWRGDEFVVLHDGGYVGLDGRHRVQVKRGDWKVHLYCWELTRV